MNDYLISKLKEGRLNKGLKQSDVTNLTGIKNTTLSNYENGITEPDIDTFLQLCELYGLDYAAILGEAYGLSVVGSDFDIKPSEIEHVKKYRALDDTGRNHVNNILDWETDRIRQLQQKDPCVANFESYTAPKRLISYYYKNASAGTGQIIFDNPPSEDIEIPDIPKYRCVSYAIGVNGNSMEPVYHDGDILLVEATREIQIGQIGIFQLNGECFVKKLGKEELISLNEDYDNIPLNESTTILGRVIDTVQQ